ncbi:MAG: DUF1194 domain-containing protein [Hyphomicrobiales bacterium]
MRSILGPIWAVLRQTPRDIGSRALLLAALVAPGAARAQEPVAIELVLALDSSASVDRREFDLQLEGLAQAFRDPDVLQAVENLRPLGAAVAVVQWGNPGESRLVLPFTRLVTPRDAKAFGFQIGLVRRWQWASATSIASALDDSRALLESNDFDGFRRVIDVSGDGRDNGGLDLDAARRRAESAGIAINGLPIMADDPGLDHYYAERVIAGASAFIEPARDFEDYVRAIREKLLRELRPLGS